MRFGAQYLPTYVPALDGPVSEFYHRMLEQIELLDHLGFDDVWMTEHHFHEYGGTVPDPAVFLTAAASRTTRIRLGIGVVVLPLRNPVQVAETYAMLDILCHGRLEFGVARGSTPSEFTRFGLDYGESAARMIEAMALVQQAWTAETVSFEGRFYKAAGVRVLPKPLQHPHPPVWVGVANSNDSFRWAGASGFHLMTLPYLYDPAELLPRIQLYREALAGAGHDPATREVLGKFHIYVAQSAAAARDEAGPYLANYYDIASAHRGGQMEGVESLRSYDTQLARGSIIAGDPAHCIAAIRSWVDRLGLTAITGNFYFGGMPPKLAVQSIRRFAEAVMPAFAAPAAARR